MYIEPNSTIKVLRGIPWDNTYQHTPRFASRDEQTTYMNSKVAYTLGKHTYVREGRGYLRVEKNVEELIGCNYLMFQNPKPDGTMGKVFYAFITATEYLNPVTTEIRYEIDVMQTWFLDCNLGQCFIERSHSATDNIGDNTVAEEIAIGDYVTSQQANLSSGLQWKLCAITGDLVWNNGAAGDDKWVSTNITTPNGGLPSMLKYNFFELDEFDDTYLKYNQYVYTWDKAIRYLINDHPGALLALAIMPYFFHGGWSGDTNRDGTRWAKEKVANISFNTSKSFQGNGSKIKNKKMFTFPYCCLELSNHMGDTAQYKYEYFNDGDGRTASFQVMSDVSADPSILFVPLYYAGKAINFDNTIYLTDFPYIGYVSDSYRQWLALNKNQRNVAYDKAYFQQDMAVVKGSVGVMTSALRRNIGGAVSSGVSGFEAAQLAQFDIDAMMAKEADLKAKAGQPIGGKGSTLLFSYDHYTVFAYDKSLKWEQAKRIDDYFSVYGYAERRIGTPNITSRPYWNYIKLANPSITPINGGVPADDVSAIVRILSNGITFWHNANNIGNYSLDNSV